MSATGKVEKLTSGLRIDDKDGRFSFVVPEAGYQLYTWQTPEGGVEMRLRPSNELIGMSRGDYFVRVFRGKEKPPSDLNLDKASDLILNTLSEAYEIELRILRREKRIFQGQDVMYIEWLGIGSYQEVIDNITEVKPSYQYAVGCFRYEGDLYWIGRSNPLSILLDPANPTTNPPGDVDDRTREEFEHFLEGFRFRNKELLIFPRKSGHSKER